MYRGADVSSDHHLVVATLRLKLEKYNTRNPKVTLRYNTRLLQDYQIALSNRYQVLADLVDKDQQKSSEDVWREQKRVWIDTCLAILGHSRKNKEWITRVTESVKGGTMRP